MKASLVLLFTFFKKFSKTLLKFLKKKKNIKKGKPGKKRILWEMIRRL